MRYFLLIIVFAIQSAHKYDTLAAHGFKRGWILKQKAIFGWSDVSKSDKHKMNKLNRFFSQQNASVIKVQDFREKVFQIFGGNEFFS